MRVYLDDIRTPATDHAWIVVRTAQEAIGLINTGNVQYISFDHDLGDNVPSGYDVAKHIERLCFMQEIRCPEWNIHSANPVGRRYIEAAMIAARQFTDRGTHDTN